MTELPKQTSSFNSQVERYVGNHMRAQEEALFEEHLLTSIELQNEVEVALAMQQALKHDSARPKSELSAASTRNRNSNRWQTYALAASVTMAVLTGYLYFDQAKENKSLQAGLESARQPNTNVALIPVRVFRSAENSSDKRTADLVVRKPPPGSVVVLDIELDSLAQQQAQLSATLADESLAELASWSIFPGSQHTQIVLPVEQIPDGLIRLNLLGQDDSLVRTQWIQFLPNQ